MEIRETPKIALPNYMCVTDCDKIFLNQEAKKCLNAG